VWPLFRDGAVETVMREGRVLETIHQEAAEWNADLLVVGSHGKGWGERLILGSVTERMLSDLPTSLLVVPVHGKGRMTERAPGALPRALKRSAKPKKTRARAAK
jgi:hypothetical protein